MAFWKARGSKPGHQGLSVNILNREVGKRGEKGVMFTSSPLRIRNLPCSSQNDVIGITIPILQKGKLRLQ